MREILFRGKRLDNGEWIEGSLWLYGEDARIDGALDFSEYFWHKVDPATVGQYTGLIDKNGKRIFEGDVLKKRGSGKERWLVSFCEGAFEVVGPLCSGSFRDDYSADNFEVVGNIHDNPELLEVTHEV